MFSPGKVIGVDTPELRRKVWNRSQYDRATGCLLWMGALSLKRRGRRPIIRVGLRVVQVTRLVLEWQAGPPPSTLHEAGHTCPAGENARCIHPRHLRWQTRQENEQHKRRPPTPAA